jgi:phage tail-like protein
MTKSANETVINPFIAFNFSVEIRVDGVAMQICDAAFSECDGLEMTMEVKTIREGGNNGKQIRLTGPLNLGSVTLKRGMN